MIYRFEPSPKSPLRKQLVVTHITYETSTLPIRVIPRVEGVNSLRSWKRLNSLHNLRTNDDDKRRKII